MDSSDLLTDKEIIKWAGTGVQVFDLRSNYFLD